MIKNSQGQVYIRYYQPISKFLEISGKQYVATVQHGVSMVLVDESNAQAVLDFRGKGCCGQPARPFSLPNQEAVNVFETGNR